MVSDDVCPLFSSSANIPSFGRLLASTFYTQISRVLEAAGVVLRAMRGLCVAPRDDFIICDNYMLGYQEEMSWGTNYVLGISIVHSLQYEDVVLNCSYMIKCFMEERPA